MRLKKTHSQYLARKIAKDIANCSFIQVNRDMNEITDIIHNIIIKDLEQEEKLDEQVNKLLDKREDDIEFYNADGRELFWMIKKKIAKDYDVLLRLEDRFANMAHIMMDYLFEEDLIHYNVIDNKVKNIITDSMDAFMQGFDEADKATYEKIQNYKRKIIPGTEDYDLIYARLYEEELIRKGLI
jgi:hypothetical protein